MGFTRALPDLRVWVCHLCALVGGVGDAETDEASIGASASVTVPPLERIRAVGKPHRLG